MRRLLALTALISLAVSAASCDDDDDGSAVVPATAVGADTAGADTAGADTAGADTAGATAATTVGVASAPVDATAGPAAPATTTSDPDAGPIGAPPTSRPASVPVVGIATEIFVDDARPTTAVEGVTEAADTRTLPTTVWYPALAPERTDTPVADAEPDTGRGPYPLIELSHGLTGFASQFATLAPVLVAAGYVVVSPDFPETTGGVGFGAASSLRFQPDDVSFTIDSILALDDDPGSRWHDLVDPGRIGIGGHSFGAMTTMLTLYNTAYTEPRVDAAVAISGAALPVEGGDFVYEGRPPLLLVHGDGDPIVPYAGSTDIYARADAPTYLLTLKGQNHGSFFDADDPDFEAFATTVVTFFDVYVKGDTTIEVPTAIDDETMSLVGRAA